VRAAALKSVEAELVVDAGGRGSRAPQWLQSWWFFACAGAVGLREVMAIAAFEVIGRLGVPSVRHFECSALSSAEARSSA